MSMHLNATVGDSGQREAITESEESFPSRLFGHLLRPGAYHVRDRNGNAGFHVEEEDTALSYDVWAVPSLLRHANDTLASRLGKARVFVILDPAVSRYYGQRIRSYLACKGIEHVAICLPERRCSEKNKSLGAAGALACRILEYRPQPANLLLAVGGGVTIDLVGFTASTFRRGMMRYVAVPTTPVAVVDAAVSSKTAVNVGYRKNAMGTFCPPLAVLFDPQLLRTIDRRTAADGMAEILKIAIMGDRDLFEEIDVRAQSLVQERFQGEFGSRVLNRAIRLFVELKWRGPFYGNRPASIRSFGHVFSRQLESASRFQLSHGQAVAVEMSVATCLSSQRGILPDEDRNRILSSLLRSGLPTCCEECDPRRIWKRVFARKLADNVNFYFPIPGKGIGRGMFLDRFTRRQLVTAVRASRASVADQADKPSPHMEPAGPVVLDTVYDTFVPVAQPA